MRSRLVSSIRYVLHNPIDIFVIAPLFISWEIQLRIRNSVVAAPVFLASVAAGMRLYKLSVPSGPATLRNDEPYTQELVRQSPEAIIAITSSDVHPPLYYLLLDAWSVMAGTDLVGLRLFSVLAGVAATVVVYWLGITIASKRVATTAAVWYAVSWFAVFMAQKARMYSLAGLCMAVALVGYVSMTRSNTPIPRRYGGILFVIGGTVTLWTHILTALPLTLCGLDAARYSLCNKRDWLPFRDTTIAGICIGLLFSPWVPALIRQITTHSGDYWIPERQITTLVGTFVHWYNGSIHAEFVSLVVSAASFAALGGAALRFEFDDLDWFLITIGAGTPLLLFAVSELVIPLYADRYVFVALPCYLLLLAREVWQRHWSVTLVLFIIVTAGLTLATGQYYGT
jgi:uncharacterized membrane protein